MSLFKKIGSKASKVGRETADKGVEKVQDKATEKVEGWQADLLNKVTKVEKHIKGKIITDFNTFKTEWEKAAGDPRQTVLFFLIAAYNYMTDKKVGENMATVVLPKTFLLTNTSSPTGFKLNQRGDGYLLEHMRENPRIVNSYLGGTPDNNYKIDPANIDMHVVAEATVETDATIKVQSAGKDLDSPCFLRKNNEGQWKLFGFSSIATGVKKTEQEKGDF
jgi:hypothetical protein